MSIHIREAKILDPGSPHHNKIFNIFIQNGVIVAIDKNEHRADTVIEAKGQILSPGWFDMKANFNDPGNEHKEDIESGSELAAASGFTGVAVLPNTQPAIQTKSHIEYMLSKSSKYLTDLYPIASITIDNKGEDLTEMIDLHYAGAVAFSDGDHSMWHTDILLKSLIYVQKFNGLIINLPQDLLLTKYGDMHEGVTSTILGMRGMPSLAEHLMIKRDIDILEYSGGRIHFSNISSAESVNLIKKAKKKGLNITCDVSIHHLIHTDKDLLGYDSNYKSNPPFREEKDRKALLNGLNEGIIDVITSTHCPQDEESKNLEFDRAEFGLTGLQTLLHTLLLQKESLTAEVWIEKIGNAPRKILGLPTVNIAENEKANLTLFDPKVKWIYDKKSNLSKSKNSPLYGHELQGKVTAVINGVKSQIFS